MALGFTFALDAFFTHRFAKSLHFFPSGMMSLISLIVLIVVALKIRKTVKAR
jgi:F0F1-type ATP synthase assembly protein I